METALAVELAREQQESAHWAYIAKVRADLVDILHNELAATREQLRLARVQLAHARIDQLAYERVNAGQVGR